MAIKKGGEGSYILYLEECPKCGADRKLDKSKLFGLTAMTGVVQ